MAAYQSAFFMLLALFLLSLDQDIYLFINEQGYFRKLVEPRIVFANSVVFVFSILLPIYFHKPSDLLFHLQFIFPILPMLVIYAVSDVAETYVLYSLVSFILMTVTVTSVDLKPYRLARISHESVMTWSLVAAYAIIIFTLASGGFKYFNIDFQRVYDFRDDAANNLPGFFGYANSLASKTLLPFAFLIAIIRRKPFYAVAALVGAFLLFGLSSHKAILFYPLSALAVFVFAKHKNAIVLMFFGYVSLLTWAALEILFLEEQTTVWTLFVDRLCLIPAALNYMFYDFFSSATNMFVFWSDSKVTLGLQDYPYDLDVPHLIGREYFGTEIAGANTGWIGAGYAHSGFAGMLLYSVIIGLIIGQLNGYAKNFGLGFTLGGAAAPLFAILLSTDLPSGLLTHGMIATLVMFSILDIKNRSSRVPFAHLSGGGG